MRRASPKDQTIKLTKGVYLCKPCNTSVPFGNKEAHEQGKKHRNLVGIRNNTFESFSKTLHVSRLPPGVLDIELSDHFSKFGHVSKVILQRSFAFVEFQTSDVLPRVLEAQHHLRGKHLLVSMRQPRPFQDSKNKNFEPPSDITQYKYLFENINTDILFEHQLDTFVKQISLTPEEISRKEKFVESFNQNLQEFFPGSTLQVFGSSASGLGFKDCDLDLTIFLPCHRDEASLPEIERNNVPSVHDVRSGRISKEFLLGLCRTNLLQFLCKVIRILLGFNIPQFIPSTRCPLVKVYNNRFQVHCDVSCNKSLGVENTRLVRLYSQIDARIHTLLMVLRFWGKKEQLVGPNHKISSYAFNWLVIFYLQKKQFVPVVETLAGLADIRIETESWDCTFCDIRAIPPVERDDTIAELLVGFFEFYSTFDFTTYVICPREGQCILKSELIALAGDELDFKITTLSIQDVFDLTHNITGSVNDPVLQNFLLKSSDLFQTLSSKLVKGQLNLNMLFERPPEPTKTPNTKKTVPTPKTLLPKELKSKHVEIRMERLRQIAGDRYDVLCKLFLDIFERALLFECFLSEIFDGKSGKNLSLAGDVNPNKKQKLDSPSQSAAIHSNPSTEVVLLHVLCKVYYRTWVGRKMIEYKKVAKCEDRMTLEETIARSKSIYSPETKILLHELEAILISSTESEKTCLTLHIIPKNDTKELNHTVLPFLKTYIDVLSLHCIDSYLKKSNSSIKESKK